MIFMNLMALFLTGCKFWLVILGHVHKNEASLRTLENWGKYLLLQNDYFQCYSLKNFREDVYTLSI